ncbi:CLUMA_CG010379, isoform A [Clunio marinus]|uniref:CLUMA_CG010379, isoform A n=1 Tax=Clunio marinus TaxID=568069 RepID=A0A1J1IBG7_9DIPT|nr:CLUMA_CG010379, isoform A [Clunio marinus]
MFQLEDFQKATLKVLNLHLMQDISLQQNSPLHRKRAKSKQDSHLKSNSEYHEYLMFNLSLR